MSPTRKLLGAALLTLLFHAPAARASDATEARAAYVDGESEYALGHYDRALERFEAAFKLSRKSALLFNIAQCHRQMRQFVMAATTYRSFIRLNPDSKQKPLAEKLLTQVESAERSQQNAATSPPLELSDSRPDGKQMLDPDAPPSIDASGPPGAPDEAAVGMPAGAESPVAQPLPAAATTAPPAKAAGKSRTLAFIGVGATGVALAGATLFGLQSKSTANEVTSGTHDRATVDSLRSQQSSQAGKANLLFGVGAGLAAVTAALFVFQF